MPDQRKSYENEVKKSADSGLSKFIKKILNDSETIEVSEIIFSDAKHEDGLRNSGDKETFEKTQNSSLRLREYVDTLRDVVPSAISTLEINGIINGKKIKISHPDGVNIYEGAIDGQKISKDDAENIWNKYYDVALERTQRLENIKKRPGGAESIE